jgi:3-oxoacyl-[acyl-carrier protein] reductase
MKLEGKVAVVFGGSSGIGRAIAERFGQEGATVAVVGGNDRSKADRVAEGIRATNGKAFSYVADVRNPSSIDGVVSEVTSSVGAISILVNSAGVYFPTPLGSTTEDAFDLMIDTHLKGTFFAINAVAAGMKSRGYGRIINIASVAGYRASPRYPLYCAAKAGIIMLTKALAADMARYGVHVNAIAPGNTTTPMNAADRVGPDAAEVMAAKAAATPSARVYSPAEEMAAAALFLATDEVRAMYGTTILLDEGLFVGV